MSERDPIPNRIGELRRAREWSFAELGAKCAPPATASEVRKIEIGQSELTNRWMRRVSAALEVRPGELLAPEDSELRIEEREIIDEMRVLRDGAGPAVLKGIRAMLEVLRGIYAPALQATQGTSAADRRLLSLVAGMSEGQKLRAVDMLEGARGFADETRKFS